MKKYLALWLSAMILLFGAGLFPLPVKAAEADAVIEIRTYEDLLRIADDPSGNYALMQDIDLAGKEWLPIPFDGTFEGNGHALLNVTVTTVGKEMADTYDGNMKVYETYFSALFGTMENATVSNLQLINFRAEITSDDPCFLGSIAGYCTGSTITGCKVKAWLDLTAHDRMFGVGGIVGYGSGAIEQTECDVTLICTDTDASTRDEQFMGGAYAAGYMDLDQCKIRIDGYTSDHGYVHSGGAVGMFMLYPAGTKHDGYITHNSVIGKITFFEDNTNRRAYCKDYIGEIMNYSYQYGGNTSDFQRDEKFDYSVNLKPDMCEYPTYRTTVTQPGCDTYGYTSYECDNCGYTYTDNYTLFQHHVTNWSVTKEATVEETGIQTGACDLCGVVLEETIERLEAAIPPASEEASSPQDGTKPDLPSEEVQPGPSDNSRILGIAACTLLLVVALTITVFALKKKRP